MSGCESDAASPAPTPLSKAIMSELDNELKNFKRLKDKGYLDAEEFKEEKCSARARFNAKMNDRMKTRIGQADAATAAAAVTTKPLADSVDSDSDKDHAPAALGGRTVSTKPTPRKQAQRSRGNPTTPKTAVEQMHMQRKIVLESSSVLWFHDPQLGGEGDTSKEFTNTISALEAVAEVEFSVFRVEEEGTTVIGVCNICEGNDKQLRIHVDMNRLLYYNNNTTAYYTLIYKSWPKTRRLHG